MDPGTGWVQNVVLTIEDEMLGRSYENPPWDLSEGTLQINDELFENMIPVPLDRRGKVILTLLDKRSGSAIVCRGNRIFLELQGEAKYVEEFR